MSRGFNIPTALMIATWESEHFSWIACGATFTSVRRYALETWNDKVTENGAKGTTFKAFEELDERYGVMITRVYPGFGERT